MTIGQRAYIALQEKATAEGISMNQECRNLYINETTPSAWNRGVCDPRAAVLREMALMGYDVIYILTGERT